MAARSDVKDVLYAIENAAKEYEEQMYEDFEAQVKWLNDVLEAGKAVASGASQKRKGDDLIPKTPKKRKRGRQPTKLTRVNVSDVNSFTIKDCQVRLEDAFFSASKKPTTINVSTESNLTITKSEQVHSTNETVVNGSLSSSKMKTEPKSPFRPAKPPRNLATKLNQKENQSPVKSVKQVVPDGFVSNQVKAYEEKIGSPIKQLNKTLTVEENNQRILSQLMVIDNVVEAKIVVKKIAKLSLSHRRSSRMRHKLSVAKNIIRKSLGIANAAVDRSIRKSQDRSNSGSPKFFSASNSPTSCNQQQAETVDRSQENITGSIQHSSPIEMSRTFVTETNVAVDAQLDQPNYPSISNHNSGDSSNSEVIPTTPPENKDNGIKIISKTGLNRANSSSSFKSSQKVSLFGTKRFVGESPSLNSYRFGTPDKMMTPQSECKRLEKIALLDARASTVLKNREEILKQRVEDQKRKREERLKKVAQLKKLKEEEREAKLKKLGDEEKKKANKKQENEEKKRLVEAELLREFRLKQEEQKLKEEKEKQAAEIRQKLAAYNDSSKVTEKMIAPSATGVKVAIHKPNLDATFNAGEALNSTYNADSYEITPKNRPKFLKNPDNYDIDALKEEDSTDDEERPKKPIPAWAQGVALKTVIIKQLNMRPNFGEIFKTANGVPNLSTVFKTKRKRFYQRTSSAIWTKPIMPSLNCE